MKTSSYLRLRHSRHEEIEPALAVHAGDALASMVKAALVNWLP